MRKQIKVGCCGFQINEKENYILFNNLSMLDDALKFQKLIHG